MPPVLTEHFFDALYDHVLKGEFAPVLKRCNGPLVVYSGPAIEVLRTTSAIEALLARVRSRLQKNGVSHINIEATESRQSQDGSEVHSLTATFRTGFGGAIGTSMYKVFVRRIEGAPQIELVEIKDSTLPGPGCLTTSHRGKRRAHQKTRSSSMSDRGALAHHWHSRPDPYPTLKTDDRRRRQTAQH